MDITISTDEFDYMMNSVKAFPFFRRSTAQGPGRKTMLNTKGGARSNCAGFDWESWRKGPYFNPNRNLPRKKMLAARRIEQLSRGNN